MPSLRNRNLYLDISFNLNVWQKPRSARKLLLQNTLYFHSNHRQKCIQLSLQSLKKKELASQTTGLVAAASIVYFATADQFIYV